MRETNEVILAMAHIFDDLAALIEAEPSLSDFVPAVEHLNLIAERARAGEPIETFVPRMEARIPSRELAQRMLDTLKRGPGPTGDEPPELMKRYAQLQANIYYAFIYSIFRHYPDLMVSDDDGPTA